MDLHFSATHTSESFHCLSSLEHPLDGFPGFRVNCDRENVAFLCLCRIVDGSVFKMFAGCYARLRGPLLPARRAQAGEVSSCALSIQRSSMHLKIKCSSHLEFFSVVFCYIFSSENQEPKPGLTQCLRLAIYFRPTGRTAKRFPSAVSSVQRLVGRH